MVILRQTEQTLIATLGVLQQADETPAEALRLLAKPVTTQVTCPSPGTESKHCREISQLVPPSVGHRSAPAWGSHGTVPVQARKLTSRRAGATTSARLLPCRDTRKHGGTESAQACLAIYDAFLALGLATTGSRHDILRGRTSYSRCCPVP